MTEWKGLKNSSKTKSKKFKEIKMVTLKRILQSQPFLFRGTTDIDYQYKLQNCTFYFGQTINHIRHTTSTSLDPWYAIIYGNQWAKKYEEEGEKAKPILLKINIEKYRDKIKPGLEKSFGEIEIEGPINFEDIEIIDSIEKLKRVTLHLNNHTRGKVIVYFKHHYL